MWRGDKSLRFAVLLLSLGRLLQAFFLLFALRGVIEILRHFVPLDDKGGGLFCGSYRSLVLRSCC